MKRLLVLVLVLLLSDSAYSQYRHWPQRQFYRNNTPVIVLVVPSRVPNIIPQTYNPVYMQPEVSVQPQQQYVFAGYRNTYGWAKDVSTGSLKLVVTGQEAVYVPVPVPQ